MQSHDHAYLKRKLGNTVCVPKKKIMVLWKASGFINTCFIIKIRFIITNLIKGLDIIYIIQMAL